MVLRLGNFKIPAVAMETAKILNNNLLRLKKRNFKMAAVAMEIIFEFTA
jgi:hypothetical protein